MKFYETHFDEYIESSDRANLHPKLDLVFAAMPATVKDMHNLIFYGPIGTGKYTQMLRCIRQYSTQNLKYEKKISISINKLSYDFKCSDIHFEIDMALLGCKSKSIWFAIYQHIIDIIITKPHKSGIIVCKNFHEIHAELLEHFYSYLHQTHNSSIIVRFVMITNHLSFIPDNIINCCRVVSLQRPTKKQYVLCVPEMPNKLKIKLSPMHITNIKQLKQLSNTTAPDAILNYIPQTDQPYRPICDAILNDMRNVHTLRFLQFRDKIYNIFIYNLSVEDCVWYIIQSLFSTDISDCHFTDVMNQTYAFFNYYNNNYRPIYHLEKYLFGLIVHMTTFEKVAQINTI
jgi:hypothetical protein